MATPTARTAPESISKARSHGPTSWPSTARCAASPMLPDTLRQVVELRVLQDRSTADVRQALGISEQNLFVRLRRARHALAG